MPPLRCCGKPIANVTEIGLRIGATDIVPAAELVEAEYAAVHDTEVRIQLHATPVGSRSQASPLLDFPRPACRPWSTR
jgi:hypothetical protein